MGDKDTTASKPMSWLPRYWLTNGWPKVYTGGTIFGCPVQIHIDHREIVIRCGYADTPASEELNLRYSKREQETTSDMVDRAERESIKDILSFIYEQSTLSSSGNRGGQ